MTGNEFDDTPAPPRPPTRTVWRWAWVLYLRLVLPMGDVACIIMMVPLVAVVVVMLSGWFSPPATVLAFVCALVAMHRAEMSREDLDRFEREAWGER